MPRTPPVGKSKEPQFNKTRAKEKNQTISRKGRAITWMKGLGEWGPVWMITTAAKDIFAALGKVLRFPRNKTRAKEKNQTISRKGRAITWMKDLGEWGPVWMITTAAKDIFAALGKVLRFPR